MIFIAENIPDYLIRRACGELPCKDCGVNTHRHGNGIKEWYMVTDKVWVEAHKPQEVMGGFLCVGCIEKRLGRELNAADFLQAPINYIFHYSERLMSRILRGITAEQLEYAKVAVLKEIEHLKDDLGKIDKLKSEIPFD